MASRGDRWVEVAVVGRPHGVRGALYVRPLNPDTELLTVGRVLAAPPRGDGSEREAGGTLRIERVERTGQGWLVKFEGVDQREVAAALTTRKLFVRRRDLPALPPGELYQSDLVGARAVDANGRELGVVRGFFSNGAHDVCVLETPAGKEALVPFLPELVVDADPEGGRLVLEIPEGLPGLDDEVGADG